MKKIFAVVFAVFMLSVCCFAKTEGETLTLSEYLGLDAGTENIERVIMYPEINLFSGADFSKKLDVDEFLVLADSIILMDTDEKMTFGDNDGDGNFVIDCYYIEVHNEDGRFASLLMTNQGLVDKYSIYMSRLPEADRKMSEEDFQKLMMLYENSNERGLPVVFEAQEAVADAEPDTKDEADETEGDGTQTQENETENESENEYNPYALAVVAAVMAVAVAVTLKLTDKKK